MKNNYQRMSKEEKINLKKEFYQTEKGKSLKNRFLRLRIISIVGIIFVILTFAYGIFQNNLMWYDYFINISLSIACIIFILAPIKIETNALNWYSIKEYKKKNK